MSEQSALTVTKHLSQYSPRLPDETLKLPEGHDTHAPADAPLQPLRYWPATHDAAEQVEQTEDPGDSFMLSSFSTTNKHHNFFDIFILIPNPGFRMNS